MATSGGDRKIKIWDLRTYRELYCYKVGAGPGQLAFSQTGLLGAGMGNIVEVKRTYHFGLSDTKLFLSEVNCTVPERFFHHSSNTHFKMKTQAQ